MKRALSKALRRAALRHFTTSRIHYRRRLRRQLAKCGGEVVVYQMGKVGSASVASSFAAMSPPWFAHHIHQLTEEQLKSLEAFVRGTFNRPLVTPEQRSNLFQQLASAEYLRKRVGSSWPWKVVTLVRDPVARNLSGFFEVLDLEMGYGLESKLQTKGREEVVRELGSVFLDAYPDHDLPLTFFDIELKASLGVDVYAEPFDKEKGYRIYRDGNVEVLVLKLEKLEECAEEAIEQFLDIKSFRLVKANVGAQKDYADTYRSLRRSIRLPDEYLDKMYGSRYAMHFYGQDELERFDAKWRRQESR